MRGGDGAGRGGAGRVGDKNIKPIPALPRGAGTKYCPIPAPPPLQGGENPHGAGRGKDGFSIFIPNSPRPHPALIRTIIVNLVNPKSLIFKVKHKSTKHEIK